MNRSPQRVALLFPGALGDFLCFLPTLCAIHERAAGEILLIAQPRLLELVRLPGMQKVSIDRREIADLFASGSSVSHETCALLAGCTRTDSWTGFENPTFASRLAQASGGRVHGHAFRGMRQHEHAVDYYARCAGVVPSASSDRALIFEDAWVASLRADHRLAARRLLIVHPGSGSIAKNWQGFAACVRLWHTRRSDAVVLLTGPAEADQRDAIEADAVADNLSLPQVAALLRAAALYVGNDSGVSHLAGIVGTPGVVLFGASDPNTWAPRSPALQVIEATARCVDCPPESFCTHRLSAEVVTDALDAKRVALDRWPRAPQC